MPVKIAGACEDVQPPAGRGPSHRLAESASASTGTSKKAAKASATDSSAKAASGPPLQKNSEIWSEAAREAKRARGGKDMSAWALPRSRFDSAQSTARA